MRESWTPTHSKNQPRRLSIPCLFSRSSDTTERKNGDKSQFSSHESQHKVDAPHSRSRLPLGMCVSIAGEFTFQLSPEATQPAKTNGVETDTNSIFLLDYFRVGISLQVQLDVQWKWHEERRVLSRWAKSLFMDPEQRRLRCNSTETALNAVVSLLMRGNVTTNAFLCFGFCSLWARLGVWMTRGLSMVVLFKKTTFLKKNT